MYWAQTWWSLRPQSLHTTNLPHGHNTQTHHTLRHNTHTTQTHSQPHNTLNHTTLSTTQHSQTQYTLRQQQPVITAFTDACRSQVDVITEVSTTIRDTDIWRQAQWKLTSSQSVAIMSDCGWYRRQGHRHDCNHESLSQSPRTLNGYEYLLTETAKSVTETSWDMREAIKCLVWCSSGPWNAYRVSVQSRLWQTCRWLVSCWSFCVRSTTSYA